MLLMFKKGEITMPGMFGVCFRKDKRSMLDFEDWVGVRKPNGSERHSCSGE
jgi:hypothetical protein